ncbi:MAG: prepilin-type N-terminal cleavage/methylation domain-containing protein [Kiritimatiellae bacterium]|nr:prepilin-type N-terminal cleavage/methylation domain-containing protein [Kiritimatiellia bacterium]
MYKKPLRGFTLIELLVVITIIGVLMGLLMSITSGIRERARDAKCCANLKQLHTAVLTYFADPDCGGIPAAYSSESRVSTNDVNDNAVWLGWHQSTRGWVDWRDYDADAAAADASDGGHGDQKTYWYGTNGVICNEKGALYEFAGNDEIYVCPTFYKQHKGPAGEKAVRSYVMNVSKGGNIMTSDAYRRILFADGSYEEFLGKNPPDSSDEDIDFRKRWHRSLDGSLDYGDPDDERIGNHHNGKGNVVFLDGHVEKVSTNDTENVCTGNWGKY